MNRVLQRLDGRCPVFHLNFAIRYYAVKFLLCDPSRTLLVRQVVRHVIVEPVGISDNDIYILSLIHIYFSSSLKGLAFIFLFLTAEFNAPFNAR